MQDHLAKPLRIKDLTNMIAQWSGSSVGEAAQPAPAPAADSTSPRLRKIFAERLAATLETIEAAREKGAIDDTARTEIAGLLHQIAGTAAYFEAEELGRKCLEAEKALLACEDETEAKVRRKRPERRRF